MIKINFIKTKKIVKILKQLINLTLLKLGIKFHSYESITDLDSRKYISSFVKQIIDSKECQELKILIIGSPGMQELKSIPKKYLKKLNVTGVDYSEPQTIHKLSTNIKVKKYLFIKEDAFKYLSYTKENKYDLIINRSFLHHISKKNKEIFINHCYRLISDSGKLFCIDWFIENCSNQKELFNSIFNYYTYRSKYTPALKNKMTTKKRDSPNFWWENMHANHDFSGGKHATREEMKKNLINAGFNDNLFIDIADPKKISNPYLWGHVMIVSSKY